MARESSLASPVAFSGSCFARRRAFLIDAHRRRRAVWACTINHRNFHESSALRSSPRCMPRWAGPRHFRRHPDQPKRCGPGECVDRHIEHSDLSLGCREAPLLPRYRQGEYLSVSNARFPESRENKPDLSHGRARERISQDHLPSGVGRKDPRGHRQDDRSADVLRQPRGETRLDRTVRRLDQRRGRVERRSASS